MKLRLHSFLECSRANGPGIRAVIWVQGCSLGCPGCFNQAAQALDDGWEIDTGELADRIRSQAARIDGITLSGGEPLDQRVAVTDLLRRVKTETQLSVILYTGFTWSEVQETGGSCGFPEFMRYVDVLVAGRYDQSQRLAMDIRGSANKTLHFLTNRYSPTDLSLVPPAELIITGTGETIVTGIAPPAI